MYEQIPPRKENLEEALDLSEEILKNIELSDLRLSVIVLKALRLSRILNDFQMTNVFEYESSGYQKTPNGISSELWELGIISNRIYKGKDKKSGEIKEYMYCESIEDLEFKVDSFQISIESARDPDISISSANPRQMVYNPLGNNIERNNIRKSTSLAKKRIAERRSYIYRYALKNNIELKYSQISEDIFSRVRITLDKRIREILPDSVKRFSAIYDNLRSENPEDWSNAVHSCRRILEDLADTIFPPQEDRTIKVSGEEKQIKLGKTNYINRILTFIDEHSDSKSFEKLVGSHLKFIEDRLISVFKAAQKGSHETIFSKEEADRYVIYTYLIVGDILSLIEDDLEV